VAALPLLVRSSARLRLLSLSVLAFALGLLVHAYLPLRTAALFAASDGGSNNVLWGDARTWHGFWWVASAQTFADKAAVVHGNASPWDLPFLPIEELDKVFALLAPAGLYFLLRRRQSRLHGVALLVGASGSLAAALVGGLDPANPDIRGYLGPAIALIAVLSGTAVAVGVAIFRLRQMRTLMAVVLLFGSLTRFPPSTKYPSLRHAEAADAQVRGLLSDLPVRAALFTQHFETGFLVGYQRGVEGARPDVAWGHLAFAGGPGYSERLAKAAPELSPVVDAYRRQQGAGAALAALDESRPVRMEPDGVTPVAVRRTLAPAGALWGPTSSASALAVEPLPAWALAEAKQDRQVRGYLAWLNFIDASWSCELGFFERARERFAELAKLVPEDERFLQLQKSCR